MNRLTTIRRVVRGVLIAALAASAAVLVAMAVLEAENRNVALTFLALLGLAVGAALTDAHLGVLRRSVWWAAAGLALIAISQVAYHLWVWTGLATRPMLYRIWWMSAVPSFTSTYLILLRAAAEGHIGRVERTIQRT